MEKAFALTVSALLLAAVAHAAGTVDASNSTITCSTITKAVVKADPPFVNGGTVPGTIKFKGKLAGCTTDAAVTSITGTFSGLLTGGTNDCASLAGSTTSTGTITIKWKASPGLIVKTSTVTVNSGSSVGSIFALGSSAYGQFDLGSPVGNALAVAGSFTGGDGGASSNATIITTQDLVYLFNLCNTGVKTLNIGVGKITLQ
jgi:hypothetical protein